MLTLRRASPGKQRKTADPLLVQTCRRVVEELGHGEGHAGVQVDWSAVLADVDSADLAAIIGRTVLGECGMGTAATTAASSAAGEGIEAAVPLAPNAGPALRRHLLRPLPIPVPGGRTRLRTWLAVGRRRARLATGFAWVQNIGALLILFAGWQVFGTSISEHHAQSALATAFSAKSSHARPPVLSGGGISLVPATTRLPEPPQGTVMARLEIPAIGLDQYVVSGTEPADLAKGPGHYPGSALPGQAGNVAIAGHRTTFGAPFFHLNDLQPGASIFLLTPSGEKLDYVVAGRPTSVSPDDTSILGDYGDNRLTLTTCTPPYSATQRLVVVAALRLPGVPLALERLSHDAPTPYRITTPTTSGWGWHSLPLALVVAAVLVGLGIGHRRLTNMLGKGMRWLVLVPIWAAGVYLLFETLTSLLPNTV